MEQKFLIITDNSALTWPYSFSEPDRLVASWREKVGHFGCEIKGEARKSFPREDYLSRVPHTEKDFKVFYQMILVNTEDEKIWSLGLGKTVKQLVENQLNAAELIILRNLIKSGKHVQKENMAEAPMEMWKLWYDFRNLRIENDLIKRNDRIAIITT